MKPLLSCKYPDEPDELLSRLREVGVGILLKEGKICLRCPKGSIERHELDQIRQWRNQLVTYLRLEQSLADTPLVAHEAHTDVPLTGSQWMPWYCAENPVHPRSLNFAFRLRGSCDLELLRRALREIECRHGALRIQFVTGGGTVRQFVNECTKASFVTFDESKYSYSEAEERASLCATEFVNSTIDLTRDPLFAACVIKLRSDDHLLVFSIDHLITDWWSNDILKREIWLIYSSLVRETPIPLPPLPLNFADYALWQDSIHSIWLARHTNYWKGRLDPSLALSLPRKSGIGRNVTRQFKSKQIAVSAELSRDVLRVSKEWSVLPAMTVLAAYVGAISACYGQRNLVVAVVDNGRDRSELASIVGCFACHLHLVIRWAEASTLADLLALATREWRSASEHRDYDWTLSLNPSFTPEILLNWISETGLVASECMSVALEDLYVEQLRFPQDSSWFIERLPFRLMLVCRHSKDVFTADLTYDEDSFSSDEAERFSEQFRQLLGHFIRQPHTSVRMKRP